MRLTLILILLLLVVAVFGATWSRGVRRSEAIARAEALTGGNPARGEYTARQLGCVACHVMPGIRGPRSNVGPSLRDFGARAFVAGAADNTAENVIKFIRDPRSVAPKSAMPDLRVTEPQAKDLAAYLYAQR